MWFNCPVNGGDVFPITVKVVVIKDGHCLSVHEEGHICHPSLLVMGFWVSVDGFLS